MRRGKGLRAGAAGVVLGGTALAAGAAGSETNELRAPEVRVTVDRLQISPDQASTVVRTVTREELDRLPVRDVQGALATVPGLVMQRTGGPFDEGSINLYGISGQGRAPTRQVIAIDGVPINNGMFPETSLNMIPLALVEHIEVIQGPGSTAYGSNAFTGVVNIVTRRPDRTGGEVTAQVGSRWGTSDASLTLGATNDAGDAHVIGVIQQRETLGHLQPGGRTDFSDSRLRNLSITGEKRIGGTVVSATALQYNFDRHNPSLIPRAIAGGTTPTAREEDGMRQHFNAGIRHALSAEWEAEFRYSFNAFEQTDRNTFPSPTTAFTGPAPQRPAAATNEERSGNVLLGKATWTTARNTLAFGYEYADARLTNNVTRQVFEGRTNGMFVQDRLLLLDDQLSVSGGLRREDASTYGEASRSGKIGFSFRPTGARWLVRGNAGTSFSAPAFNQLFTPNTGNPNLKAERLFLWEIGGELEPLHRLRLGATYFEGKHRDPIFPRPVGPGGSNRFINVSPNPEYAGFTLTADWNHVSGLGVGGSHTYNDPGINTFHSNRHLMKADLRWVSGPWTTSLLVIRAEGRYWADGSQAPAPNYTTADARVTYRVDARWTLMAMIENLFNEDYATRADRQGVALGQEVFVGVPRPGRFAMLGATYAF
jgi:vitamin B12 transporter